MKSISNGMLAVAIVCRPGPNTSRAFPSRKKTADWLSRTITCDPMRKSPMPVSGNRWTISSFISFGYSMTSNILAMVRLLLCCRPQLIIADAGIAYKRCTCLCLRSSAGAGRGSGCKQHRESSASLAAGSSALMLAPVPRSRCISISAMMLTAISSGVSARSFKSHGRVHAVELFLRYAGRHQFLHGCRPAPS